MGGLVLCDLDLLHDERAIWGCEVCGRVFGKPWESAEAALYGHRRIDRQGNVRCRSDRQIAAQGIYCGSDGLWYIRRDRRAQTP